MEIWINIENNLMKFYYKIMIITNNNSSQTKFNIRGRDSTPPCQKITRKHCMGTINIYYVT